VIVCQNVRISQKCKEHGQPLQRKRYIWVIPPFHYQYSDPTITAAYDYQTIHAIVDESPVLHVSFNPSSDDPFPTILPMIGYTGSFAAPSAPASGPLDVYLHGYVSSRLMCLPSSENGPSLEDGLPICIAATLLDGLILALTPNHHSMNYRSAVLHGYATLVTDLDEKLWAMEHITNRMIPKRWENTRVPPNKVEMQSTSILRVSIVSASAKIRSGGPGEDRKDEKDEAIRGKVWTGVLPVWNSLGAPVSAEGNVVPVPDHVKELVGSWNSENQKTAMAAAVPQN
jgi:nitroimidazol reductase NimA-like FMN-containing flavoprotein (pyridoxamine 5'-phosphate oxidase superfamily)